MELHLLVDGHALSIPGLVCLGLAVGYVAGMFGVGGGFLLTPLLVVVFGVPLPVAVGSGLSQMIGTSLVAMLRHQRSRQGEIRFDLLMLPGGVLGADAGARALTSLAAAGTLDVAGHPVPAASLVVESSYAVMLIAIAALFWRHGRGTDALELTRRGPLARLRLPPYVDLPALPLTRVSAVLIAWIGLGLGFLSGLLGIGGGVALMPVLMYGFGFPIRQAAGTGIIVLLVTAAYGTFVHARLGHVHLGLAMVLLAGSSLSAQLGARATAHLPASTLRRVFALVLLVTVAAVLWKLGSRWR
jgi:uncharacterized protein